MLIALMLLPVLQTPPDRPERVVKDNVLSSERDPQITIEIARPVEYVGADRWVLYGVADCEIHVFVEADAAKRIQRFYWVQFESYLPSRPDARYDYGESDRRMNLWGAATWARPFLADTTRTPRPGSDSERVRAILANAGYVAPPHLLAVRLVRLLDDPQGTGYGRRELMMIYAEDLAPSGVAADQLTTDGRPNERFTALEGPMIERATTAFAIEAR